MISLNEEPVMEIVGDGIGFETTKIAGKLPEVENVEERKMVREAEKSVKYGGIREKIQEKADHAEGKPTDETMFPPELVVSITETISAAIKCERFKYDENESKITAMTISLLVPGLNKKIYYLITSVLILANKLIKCANQVNNFVTGKFHKNKVGGQNDPNMQ